jgi:hypothetical protein
MPVWMQAGIWGFIAGAALLLGAAEGYFLRMSQRMVSTIMAFGSGVLISALSFDLMDEAYQRGGCPLWLCPVWSFLAWHHSGSHCGGGRGHSGHASRYHDPRSV